MKNVLGILFLGCLLLKTQPAHSAQIQKDWTILVYLNGNNSLDDFGALDINQMEEIGSSDRVDVIVQWASKKTRKTFRLKAVKDNDLKKVTSPKIQDLGLVDMGNVHNFVDFVKWGVQNFPAKHYLVDIWNHGNGWERSKHPITKDVSYDDISKNQITTEQLNPALAEIKNLIGHNVDIVGFDACLMGQAEIASEIDDSVDYLAASEELEPGTGWAYNELLAAMNDPNSKLDSPTVAKALVDTYVNSYSKGGIEKSDDVTFSVIKLSAFKELYPALSNLAENLNTIAKNNPQALGDALSQTLAFYTYNANYYFGLYKLDDYRDLGDFLEVLQSANMGFDSNVVSLVQTKLESAVVSSSATGKLKRAQGLALWAPGQAFSWQEMGKRYKGLNFDKKTHWSQWIETYSNSGAGGTQ